MDILPFWTLRIRSDISDNQIQHQWKRDQFYDLNGFEVSSHLTLINPILSLSSLSSLSSLPCYRSLSFLCQFVHLAITENQFPSLSSSFIQMNSDGNIFQPHSLGREWIEIFELKELRKKSVEKEFKRTVKIQI